MNMIMKSLNMKRLLLLAAAVSLLASCEKDPQMQPSIDGVKGGVLSIESAVLYPLGDQVEFVIATDEPWTVTGVDDKWLTFEKKVGSSTTQIRNGASNSAGTTKLVVRAKENHDSKDRACDLRFRAGSFTATINVSQAAPYLRLVPVTANDDTDADGTLDIPFEWYEYDASTVHAEKFDMNVESNIPWRIVPELNTKSAGAKAGLDYDALLYAGVSEAWIRYAALAGAGRDENWIKTYIKDDDGRTEISTDIGYDGDSDVSLTFIPEWFNTDEVDYALKYRVIPDSRSNLDDIMINFTQPKLLFTTEWVRNEGEDVIIYDAAYIEPRVFTVSCERPWKLTSRSESETGLPEASEWLSMNLYDGDVLGDPVNMDTYIGASGGEVSTHKVRVNATVNPSGAFREGWLYLTMDSEGIVLSKPMNLLQRKYVFDVNSLSTVELGNGDVASYDVNVHSSGPWSISQDSGSRDWFTVTPTSGVGGTLDKTVALDMEETAVETFSYKFNAKNPETSPRTARLAIAPVNAETKANLNKTIDVTQARFEWDVRTELEDNGKVTFGARADRDEERFKKSITITCSDAWTVSVAYDQPDNKDWLEFSEDNGEECNQKTITFNPGVENMVEAKRTATITVTSTYNGLKETIGVEQRGINFGLTTGELPEVNLDFAAYNAGSQTVSVMSSHPWEVESNPDWVTVSESGTEDDGQVVIEVKDNLTLYEREGDVVLYSRQGNKDKRCTVKIHQEPFVFSLDAKSFTDIRAYSNGAAQKSNLKASAGWHAVNSSWVTVTPSSGTGDRDNLSFAVKSNPTTAARSCTVDIVSDAGDFKETVSFSQAAYQFNVSAKSPSSADLSYTFEPVYNNTNPTLNVVCSGPWELSGKESWITVTPGSDNGSDTDESAAQEVSIKVGDYTDITKDRTDEFEIISRVEGVTHSKTIKVTQKKYNFSVNRTSFNESVKLEALNPGTRSFSFTSSGNWTVTSNQSWAKISSSDASGDSADGRTVTVTFDENYDKTERSAVITVSSWGGVLKETLSVTQKQFDFDTTPVTETFKNIGNADKQVTMSASMSTWKASADKDWITVSPASGTGAGTVTIKVADNLAEARSGKVEIVSDRNAALKKVITVNQDAFVFDVSPAALTPFDAAVTSGQTVAVKCTGAWTATTADAWITVTPASGSGETATTITITPAANEGAAREGTVKVASTLAPQHVMEIKVSQKAKPAED